MKALILVTIFLFSVSAFSASGEGNISAGGMKDYANLTITGQAAKVIFEAISKATQTSHRMGSLITTTRLGRDITCTYTAEVALVYTCRLSIDSAGSANSNFLK